MAHGTLVITVPAQHDLAKLWDDIAQDDPAAADRMVDQVLARADLLADFPSAGRIRPELGAGLRSSVVDPYLIVYRPIRGGIVVARVPHTAQDIRQMAEEGGFEQA